MWRRYLPFWRPNVEDDIDEESGFHLQSWVEDLKAEGWSPKAAQQEARRRFGSVANVRKECVDAGNRQVRRRRPSGFVDEL
jgi:hypothetical protein